MYLVAQGHQEVGPGNSTIQRIDWTGSQEREMRGFSGMGCGCGQCGGLGLFDSGADFSQWGAAEWAVVAGGAYLAISIATDTRRVATSVRRTSEGTCTPAPRLWDKVYNPGSRTSGWSGRRTRGEYCCGRYGR